MLSSRQSAPSRGVSHEREAVESSQEHAPDLDRPVCRRRAVPQRGRHAAAEARQRTPCLVPRTKKAHETSWHSAHLARTQQSPAYRQPPASAHQQASQHQSGLLHERARAQAARTIIDAFLKPGAAEQVNLPSTVLKHFVDDEPAGGFTADLFDRAIFEISLLLRREVVYIGSNASRLV